MTTPTPRATEGQQLLLDALADGPPDDAEWHLFVRQLRLDAIAHDSHIDTNRVRILIRDAGGIKPQRIGSFFSRARREGLITRSGFDVNDDTKSRNVGKPQWHYVWSGDPLT